MKYSVIYAHLDSINVIKGQKLEFGDIIGVMGNTGKSYEPHLHLSVVEGVKTAPWSLSSMNGYNIPNENECLRFISDTLFGSRKYSVINGWLGYESHFGYDVTCLSDTVVGKTIFWNQSIQGTVTNIGSQLSKDNGWGNYVIVTYERVVDLKYRVGDNVILNGNLYRDSYGNGIGNYYTNYKCVITLINNQYSAIKPYNVNNGLGWVGEDSIVLDDNSIDVVPDNNVDEIPTGNTDDVIDDNIDDEIIDDSDIPTDDSDIPKKGFWDFIKDLFKKFLDLFR